MKMGRYSEISEIGISKTSIFLIFINVFFNYQFIKVDAAAIAQNPIHATTSVRVSSVCLTPECVTQASYFIRNIDPTIQPCDDFYQFACGNYIRKADIPTDKSSTHTFNDGELRLRNNLLREIKKVEEPNELQIFKNVKIHFRNCMNESRIEDENATTAIDIIYQLGGWPVLHDNNWKENEYVWEETIDKIGGLGMESLFPFTLFSYYDPEDSSKYILSIFSAHITIDDAFDTDNNVNLRAYETFINEIAVLLGANEEQAQKEIEELILFEKKLHQAKTKPEDMDDISLTENTLTIKELIEKYPNIEWLSILNKQLNPSGVTVDENIRIVIYDSKFVNEVGDIINTTPKRVLANFQIWNILRTLIDYMPKRFREKELEYHKVVKGVQSLSARENYCYETIQDNMLVALSALYVRKLFNEKAKLSTLELIDSLRKQLKLEFQKTDWMDDETRKAAIEKLDAMKASVAYPEELMDDNRINEYYGNLIIEEGSYLRGAIGILKVERDISLSMFQKTIEQVDWIFKAGIATVNAYYSPGNNEMNVIAGILQEPFFNVEQPKYLNYGGIGYVIGHEMIHGFDTNGRKYDKTGNFYNWWKNDTEKQFNDKTQCLIDIYSDYTMKQVNLKVNGKLTKGENIADTGGIKLAYNAYKDSVKNGLAEPYLPGLDYTPQQMFWINAASTWCGKFKDEALRYNLNTDVHSPMEARINVVFSNSYEFAVDFKCAKGSNMNPTKKCVVW